MSNSTNPFAALIDEGPSNEGNDEIEDTPVIKENKSYNEGKIIERIFGITLDEKASKELGYVYFKDLALIFPLHELTNDVLKHALFERLFLQNPKEFVLSNSREDRDFLEAKVITYLYNCYCNVLKEERLHEDTKKTIIDLILRNIITAMDEPELYEGQDICEQMYEIMKQSHDFPNFLETFLDEIGEKEDIESLKQSLENILKTIHQKDASQASINIIDPTMFHLLELFTTREYLIEIFLNYCTPKLPVRGGVDYANTLLGALLSISILPKMGETYSYFTNSFNLAGVSTLEGMLWANINKLTEFMHQIVSALLRMNAKYKAKTLDWFGGCLRANVDRGKLWNAQAPELNPASYSTVSDAFMINFTNVLLRLCQPFCSSVKDHKILKVDPTYCAVPENLCSERGVHLLDLFKETCLIPASTDDEENESSRPIAASYSFVSECFFMTHRSMDLGFRVTSDKLVKITQDLHRMERAYEDAASQSGGLASVINPIKQRLTEETAKYLSIKATLSEPNQLKMMFNFISSTAWWLTQVAAHADVSEANAPLNEVEISFPFPSRIPVTLTCIPEFVVENIVCFLVFIRRFNPRLFEEESYEELENILTFILVYMGSPERMKNPHLRARLAEALETLLPYHKEEPNPVLNPLGSFQRNKLFKEYAHRKEIVENLLSVFVGIEMTGQSVQFEQKFNYRRPMYAVMDYLWEMEDYRKYFKELAVEAEENMEAVSPPLFLRFVNLLINDAVFLLDEALSNMAKIREMQTARENGDWDQLPPQERVQNFSLLQNTGYIARFDNILGRDTIETLERLTSEITIVFTHSTMVDRVAAMLNYFLYSLVGPKKKIFKVKDHKNEYSFDPAETVLFICKIYVNLKESDSFCFAVSQDGRSYSPKLFSLAEDVLARIGGGSLIGELQDVASKVAKKAEEYQVNEEIVAEAPDRFMDPIMNSIMQDPVILPSSRQTVDRTTIARHLLSDQTDPFNRAPLTMEQVIPNTELAEEIRQWLEERRNK